MNRFRLPVLVLFVRYVSGERARTAHQVEPTAALPGATESGGGRAINP